MNTAQTLLVAGALGAIILSATPVQAADPKPLTITTMAGDVRIQQNVPCGQTLNLSTSIAKGGMEMTWLETREGVLFDLTKLVMFVSPFRAEATCRDYRGSVDFRQIGIQLATTVRFTGEETESGVFSFKIPKEQFLIYETVLDSVAVKQPETSYQRPSEDVTGVIDLRDQTVALHVVLTADLHFQAGCSRDRCVIDEVDSGTTTVDVKGTTAVVKR